MADRERWWYNHGGRVADDDGIQAHVLLLEYTVLAGYARGNVPGSAERGTEIPIPSPVSDIYRVCKQAAATEYIRPRRPNPDELCHKTGTRQPFTPRQLHERDTKTFGSGNRNYPTLRTVDAVHYSSTRMHQAAEDDSHTCE